MGGLLIILIPKFLACRAFAESFWPKLKVGLTFEPFAC